MAANIIKRVDVTDGVDVNYKEVTEFFDNSPMSDDKCDGVVYRKARDGRYYQRQFDSTINQNIVKKNIAELRAITPSEILMLKMGIYKGVEVRGYHQEKDTPTPIIYTLSDSDKNDDGGRIITVGNHKFEHIFKDVIDVKYYGATAESADSSAIINKVIEEAKNSALRVLFSDIFKASNNIKILEGVHLAGINRSVSGVTSSGNVTFTTESDVTISDMFVENKSKFRNAFYGRDVAAPTVLNCRINGRFNYANSTNQVLNGPQIHYCDVDVNFENDYNGVEQYDVFTFNGYLSNKITNNRITVKNVHRLFKFSSNVTEYYQNTIANPRDILIQGNTIIGSGGKQVIDTFNSTSVIKLLHNHFELTDNPERGSVQWSSVLVTKTANDQRDVFDLGDSILIEGNTGTIPCDLAHLQASWSANSENYTGTRFNSVKVINNHIRKIRDEQSNDFLRISYYNDVVVDGNTFEVPKLPNNVVLHLSSNERAVVTETNTFIGGQVKVDKSTNNAQLVQFTGVSKSVVLNPLVRDFNCDAAVKFELLDCDYVEIDNLRSFPLLDATNNCRPIHFTSTSRLAELVVKNCKATSKTGGQIVPIIDANAKSKFTEIDNDWNPRFRGYVTALPTTGTYQRGDTLKRSNSAIGLANEWVCVTGNSNGGHWRAISWTTGNGRTANRPTLTASDVGVEYYDTDLQKFVKWSGTAWIEL